MEETQSNKNVTYDEVMERIENFPIQPMRRDVIITLNTMEVDEEEELGLTQSPINELQYVLAVGTHVHDVIAGDAVGINIEKMMTFTNHSEDAYERTGTIKIDPIEVDGVVYALVDVDKIKYIDRR